MPHIHQKTQHCGLNIYHVDQCHQISEEIEHNKSSLPILGPSENTLPPVVLCYCSYSGHNPHSGQKVRWTELLKFAAKIKKGRLLLGGSDWCNSFIWLLLLKETTWIEHYRLPMHSRPQPFYDDHNQAFSLVKHRPAKAAYFQHHPGHNHGQWWPGEITRYVRRTIQNYKTKQHESHFAYYFFYGNSRLNKIWQRKSITKCIKQ